MGPVTSAAGPGTGGGGDGGQAPGGNGGAGGSGGEPEPGVVPGCERLAWVGDPVVLDAGLASSPRVATLANGDVGVVYARRGRIPEVVESRIIAQPFASWPPSFGPPAVALEAADDNLGNEDPVISARSDGTFSLWVRFQEHGVVARMGGRPRGLVYEGYRAPLMLDPRVGAGGYLLGFRDGDVVLDHFATLDADAMPTLVGPLPRNDCWVPSGVVQADGSLLLARASNYRCEAHGPVELLRATQQDGVVAVGSLPAAERSQLELVARSGGAWLVEAQSGGVSATPLDALGAPSGPAWISAPLLSGRQIDVKPWRSGFVIAEFANVEDAHGASLRVSDGVNVTTLAPVTDGGTSTRVLAVAVSADGGSLVVVHEVHPQLVVQRADCMPSAP